MIDKLCVDETKDTLRYGFSDEYGLGRVWFLFILSRLLINGLESANLFNTELIYKYFVGPMLLFILYDVCFHYYLYYNTPICISRDCLLIPRIGWNNFWIVKRYLKIQLSDIDSTRISGMATTVLQVYIRGGSRKLRRILITHVDLHKLGCDIAVLKQEGRS